MKSIKLLALAALVFCMAGTAFAEKITLPKEKLDIDGKMSVTLTKLDKDTAMVVINNMKYTSKDPTFVFLYVACSTKNMTKEKLERVSGTASLELVCREVTGKFSVYQTYNAAFAMMNNPVVKAGKTFKEETFFQYPMRADPVAIMAGRKSAVILIPEDDKRYPEVQKIIRKAGAVETMMTMAETASFDDILAYLLENEISINETDRETCPILAYAVKHNNMNLVEGLLDAGADVNQLMYQNKLIPILPIHLAVETRNPDMIRTLATAGASLTESVEKTTPPAAMAVQNNAHELLPLFKELGVDFTTLTIPMANRSPMPVREYAEQKERKEILEFLDTL